MLLKTRREFTLCFFLFVPLGMAGYCADVKPADSPVRSTKSHDKTERKTNAANKKGGQPAPQSPAGGLSSAEQLTRLLVDGRRAYRDGEMLTAKSYFRDALKLDQANPEARKYLREIEEKATGAKFSPDALSAEIPAGVAGKVDRVDVVGTVNAVKANATPATLTQKMDSGTQASVSGSVSMALNGGNSFSRPVSIAVSLDGSKQEAPSAEPVKEAAAAGTDAEKPAAVAKSEPAQSSEGVAPEAANAGKEALDRLGLLAKRVNTQSPTSARNLISEASLAVKEVIPAEDKKEISSAAPKQASAASRLALEAEAKELEEKAAKEKATAEKAEKAAKAEAEKAEKLAAEKKAKAEKEAADELARVKAEAEKAEREKADRILAEKKAEEEKAAAEAAKKAEEERKAAEVAKKAEEKRQAAEAAKKAEEEKAAAEAAKKAEKEREAAEAKKKAEDARQLAAAEKEAREAAAKVEKEKQVAKAAEDRKQFDKAVSETNDGIKLYNAGKYTEAKAKFETALATQADYREAKSYLDRTERKLETASASKTEAAPVLNLDQLNDELKQVAQASTAAATEPAAAEATPEAKAEEPKSNGGDAAAADAESADPIVQADKLVREARTQLADGNRARALELAQQAATLDPKNVDATALSADLAADSAKALPSATPVPVAAEVNVASDASTETTSLDVAATTIVDPPVIGMGPSGIGSLLTEGRSKFESGQLREALTTFNAVLEKDPDNAEAKRYINKIEVARAGDAAPMSAVPGAIATAQTAQDAEAAFQQGLVAYQAGRLDVAVQHWNFSLTLDPNHPRAVQYLEQTRGEYEAWVQQHQYNAIELQKEVTSTNKLETGVTYDSAGQKTLVEFLQAMSLITDINFYVADGVDADLRVTARFSETPLQDALDIVLLPVGLKWHRTGDVVSVTTDLHNKFYNLTPDQVRRLKPLLENRTLQRYLYGPEGLPPMRNVELLLDDRENMLIVTDSVENLSKIEAFLKDLQVDAPQQLVFKNWKIRPEEGNRIKALVEAIVKVNSDAAWDLDRRVVIDGDDLIVKDTADNVAKIEQLLLDKNFLTKLQDQTLGVQSYSLIPREPIGPENVEQARDMAQSIVTVVKTILYSQSGEESAAAEGRRFWYDPNTLQLTITDFPDNLSIVSDYLKSLPTLSSSEQKSEIIWLKHQTAPEMKGLLEQVLGITGGVSAGSSSGNAVTKTLRTEGELVFNDLRIRVKEIRGQSKGSSGNSTQNERTATLIVRSATNSQDLTLDEFDTEFLDEYEITAEEIRPSGMDDGEGSIRLRVAVSAGAVAGTGFGGGGFGGVGGFGAAGVAGLPGVMAPGVGVSGFVGGSLSEELTIIVEAVPNMNALLIRYTNPSDLDEVRSWLKQLDVPVLQVSIETKLVEVNETRAKEFMPEFNWANIGHGSPDFSNGTNLFDFAKNDALGELGRSPFDPFPEDPFNAGLLKGTSVFNLVTGGESPISFTLRALESEGVVNLTNGPTVTVENGQTADFQIARDFGLIGESLGQDSENTRVPRINHVNMSVSPQITQAGEIRLEITDLQLNDFGNQIQNVFPILLGGSGTGTTSVGENGPAISGVLANQTGWGTPATPIMASPVGNVPYEVRRRQLSTVARVKNHGTIVLGGWMGERSRTNDSGVPILRNLPYVGKLLFGRTSDKIDRTNLLIFLTCHLIDP